MAISGLTRKIQRHRILVNYCTLPKKRVLTIHAIDEGSELKEKLVKKLYSLYDFGRVIHAITKKEETENIYNLIQAIKQQK